MQLEIPTLICMILLGVLRICAPAQVDQMETALAQGDRAEFRRRALTQLYEHLPSLDLSQVLAESAEAACRVITSRSCGWSNPATAQRTNSAVPSNALAAIL
jgi:hypothetical protein